jgi:hypothetical protein
MMRVAEERRLMEIRDDIAQELREKRYQYSADGKLIPIPEPVPAIKPEAIKPLKRWMGTIFWAFVSAALLNAFLDSPPTWRLIIAFILFLFIIDKRDLRIN